MCAVATAMGYKDLYLTGIDFYQEKRESLRISSPKKKILLNCYLPFHKVRVKAIFILWNMI